jgi:uncharacterized protein YegP (UPF0339 family)
MGKFQVYKDKKGEFRFRLNASNGQTILSGEGYSSKAACMNGIESVRKNSADDSKFQRLEAKNGSHYFNLKAANNQVIGNSQMYSSVGAMENGVASVMNNAPDAPVEEQE